MNSKKNQRPPIKRKLTIKDNIPATFGVTSFLFNRIKRTSGTANNIKPTGPFVRIDRPISIPDIK